MSEAKKPDKRVVELYKQTIGEIRRLESKITDLGTKKKTIDDFFDCMKEENPEVLRPGLVRHHIAILRTDRDELSRSIKPLEAELVSKRRLLEELDICPVCEGSGYYPPKTHVREGPGPGPLCSTCSGTGTKTGAAKINSMSPEEQSSFREQKIESDRKKMAEGWFTNY